MYLLNKKIYLKFQKNIKNISVQNRGSEILLNVPQKVDILAPRADKQKVDKLAPAVESDVV